MNKSDYVIRRVTLPIWQGARGMKKAQENPVEFVVLKAQAFVEFATHFGDFFISRNLCVVGRDGFAYNIRQNGRPQVWKTREEVRVPFKYGLKDCFTAKSDTRDAELSGDFGPILVPAEHWDDCVKRNPNGAFS